MTTRAGCVVADIGGTHARFAVAAFAGDGGIVLGPPTVVRTADHPDLPSAWRAFAAGQTLPRSAAIAVAAPLGGDRLTLTNNLWVLRPATLADELGVDRVTLLNDFGAVAYAVASLDASAFVPLCGPDRPLDFGGVVSVVGPGTGLGVATIVGGGGGPRIVPSEGGHVDFAPRDAVDDALLARLRARFGRVSVERIVSGPGLAEIHAVLAEADGRAAGVLDHVDLWGRALAGDDRWAVAALDRFCHCLGAVAGDIALTHGAGGVVIAGGIGLRLAAHLPRSGFAASFAAKGRFAARMAAIPVKVLVHPHPGLFGAAAALAGAID